MRELLEAVEVIMALKVLEELAAVVVAAAAADRAVEVWVAVELPVMQTQARTAAVAALALEQETVALAVEALSVPIMPNPLTEVLVEAAEVEWRRSPEMGVEATLALEAEEEAAFKQVETDQEGLGVVTQPAQPEETELRAAVPFL